MAVSNKFQNFQQSHFIWQFLHSNLNSFSPFFMCKNGTTVKHGYPSFHFGTFHTNIPHAMSLYLAPNLTIFTVIPDLENILSVGLFQHFFPTLSPSNKLLSSSNHLNLGHIAKYTHCTIFSY